MSLHTRSLPHARTHTNSHTLSLSFFSLSLSPPPLPPTQDVPSYALPLPHACSHTHRLTHSHTPHPTPAQVGQASPLPPPEHRHPAGPPLHLRGLLVGALRLADAQQGGRARIAHSTFHVLGMDGVGVSGGGGIPAGWDLAQHAAARGASQLPALCHANATPGAAAPLVPPPPLCGAVPRVACTSCAPHPRVFACWLRLKYTYTCISPPCPLVCPTQLVPCPAHPIPTHRPHPTAPHTPPPPHPAPAGARRPRRGTLHCEGPGLRPLLSFASAHLCFASDPSHPPYPGRCWTRAPGTTGL